jgi:hypothetical protein
MQMFVNKLIFDIFDIHLDVNKKLKKNQKNMNQNEFY